jgi:hypothetical protein
VPPIYQPEVAAEAIVFASKSRRKEIYVGLSTVIAVVGNKLFPRLGDYYLGKTGIQGQQTPEMDNPDKPNNLYQPVGGDPGAHGRFDARARSFSLQLWADKNRAALATVGLFALICSSLGLLLRKGASR